MAVKRSIVLYYRDLHFSLMGILFPTLRINWNESINLYANLQEDHKMTVFCKELLQVKSSETHTTSSTRSSTIRPCSSVRTLVTHIQPSSSSLWTINMSPLRKLTDMQRIQKRKKYQQKKCDKDYKNSYKCDWQKTLVSQIIKVLLKYIYIYI